MNFNQITIYTNKITESVEFYKNLGLRLIVDSAPRYVRFECPVGNSTLSLHETSEESKNANIVIYFECENLDEEVRRLENIGVQFDSEIKNQSWLWREIYLRDPNENKICLYYAGENRQNPPWRVE